MTLQDYLAAAINGNTSKMPLNPTNLIQILHSKCSSDFAGMCNQSSLETNYLNTYIDWYQMKTFSHVLFRHSCKSIFDCKCHHWVHNKDRTQKNPHKITSIHLNRHRQKDNAIISCSPYCDSRILADQVVNSDRMTSVPSLGSWKQNMVPQSCTTVTSSYFYIRYGRVALNLCQVVTSLSLLCVTFLMLFLA